MKKTILLFLFLLLTIDSSFAQNKAAETEILLPGSETICEADIFYYWKVKPPLKKENAAAAVKISETKVLFQTIGEQGANETDIKNKLNAKMTLAQKQALEDCQSQHQDQGLCLTKKIKSQQDLLSKLDFATKNTIIAAANSDCQNEQGFCGEVEASEIRCYINKTRKLKIDLPATVKTTAKGVKKK